MKIKGNILGIAEGIAALVLLVGSLTFFSACKGSEGKFMTCHWAQNTVSLIAAVLVLQSVLRIFIPDKGVKAGLALSVFLLSIAVIFVPGTLINLCMMDTMECHTVFKPAVIATGAALAVISGADTISGIIRSGKK